jgi:hypothetical protein
MPNLERVLSLLEVTTTIEHTQNFIRSINPDIPSSANSWVDLRGRIENAVTARSISMGQLTQFVAETEECARQQIIWYSCDPAYVREVVADLETRARRVRLQLNVERSVLTAPRTPAIVLVGSRPEELKLKLVERREWWEPVSDLIEGREGAKIRTKQFRQQSARAVVCLRVEVPTGLGWLHVQKVEATRIEYNTIEEAWRVFAPLVEQARFQPFDLSRAFEPLLASDEVIRKKGNIFDAGGRPISFGTRGSATDDFIQSGFWSRSATEEEFTTRNLGLSWKENGNQLESPLLTFISSMPEQIGGGKRRADEPISAVYINRHCVRSEITHVIERLRHFNR